MKWLGTIALVISAALLLPACGGGDDGNASAGVTISAQSEVVAESDTNESNAPPVTKQLVREWPHRWCGIRIGETREQATIAMGAYPTDENSHKIPLIPPIRLNSQGENTAQVPEPAGSDTWEAPGSYQFNVFYDTSLRVQQLDFEGPPRDLPCPAIRIR